MKGGAVTADRIERALRFVAYLVARDEEGEVYLQILDRLEQELAECHRRERPRDRARRLLQGLTVDAFDAPGLKRPNTKPAGAHDRLS